MRPVSDRFWAVTDEQSAATAAAGAGFGAPFSHG
jgi:hypothetical protein